VEEMKAQRPRFWHQTSFVTNGDGQGTKLQDYFSEIWYHVYPYHSYQGPDGFLFEIDSYPVDHWKPLPAAGYHVVIKPTRLNPLS
jgi:hypothetical protein